MADDTSKQQIPSVVTAQRFQLVNAAGEKRAVLKVDENDNPYLTMYSQDSNEPRLEMGLEADSGPCLKLNDKKGNLRAVIDLDRDEDPGIALYDSQSDRARIRLIAIDDGDTHLWFCDTTGQKYARLFVNNEEDGTGFVFHEQGNIRAVLSVNEEGTDLFFCDNGNGGESTNRFGISATEGGPVEFFLNSKTGNPGVSVHMGEADMPEVTLHHQATSTRWTLSLAQDGTAQVTRYSQAGQTVWSLSEGNKEPR